jgi:hypothetical protein
MFSVRCRYCGTALLTAPRIGDTEAASIVEHLAEHVVFERDEEPTFSELLDHVLVERG